MKKNMTTGNVLLGTCSIGKASKPSSLKRIPFIRSEWIPIFVMCQRRRKFQKEITLKSKVHFGIRLHYIVIFLGSRYVYTIHSLRASAHKLEMPKGKGQRMMTMI